MHDFEAAAVGHSDGHDKIDSVGDSLKSGGSDWARVQRRGGPEVLNGHVFLAPFGSYRWVRGTVASIDIPIATSAASHDAVALGNAYLGQAGFHGAPRAGKHRSEVGTRTVAAIEKRRLPPGRPARRCHAA